MEWWEEYYELIDIEEAADEAEITPEEFQKQIDDTLQYYPDYIFEGFLDAYRYTDVHDLLVSYGFDHLILVTDDGTAMVCQWMGHTIDDVTDMVQDLVNEHSTLATL